MNVRMKQYEDYCPSCPTEQKHPYTRMPDKCRRCTATDERSALIGWLDAELAWRALGVEIEMATKGLSYWLGKQQEFRKLFKISQGSYRAVRVGNKAVVLDYRGSELVISMADMEPLH